MISNDLIIIVLLGLIVFLVVERHFFTKQVQLEKDKLLEELSRTVKAVIAKNASDYVMTTSIDKVPTEPTAPLSPDLVPEESLTDDEFMTAINKDIAKPS